MRLKKEDFKDLGLDDDQLTDTLLIAHSVDQYPQDVAKVVRESGLTPSEDPEILAYQLIWAKRNSPKQFDSAINNYSDELPNEFLGGLGAAVGTAASKTAKWLRRKKDETGKGLFERVGDKIRERRAERKAGKEEEEFNLQESLTTSRPDSGSNTTGSNTSSRTDQSSKTSVDKKEETPDTLKKKIKTWQIATISLAVAVIGFAVYVFRN